jgi:hypothetical protein
MVLTPSPTPCWHRSGVLTALAACRHILPQHGHVTQAALHQYGCHSGCPRHGALPPALWTHPAIGRQVCCRRYSRPVYPALLLGFITAPKGTETCTAKLCTVAQRSPNMQAVSNRKLQQCRSPEQHKSSTNMCVHCVLIQVMLIESTLGAAGVAGGVSSTFQAQVPTSPCCCWSTLIGR